MTAHTGFAQGHEPSAELVQRAVMQAMSGVQPKIASSVLLFLTSAFNDPQPALKAAARIANCTQIMGCVAPGIFTHHDSAINVPAAAAMVLTDGVGLQAAHDIAADAMILTLARAGEIATDWSDASGTRFGALTAQNMPIWRAGRLEHSGYCEAVIQGVRGVIGIAPGIRTLNAFQPITAAQGHDVVFLGGKPALQTLQQAWPETSGEFALNRLMACVANSAQAAADGQYQTLALMGANAEHRSVTLSQKIDSGLWLCWAMRDAEQAQHDMTTMLNQLQSDLAAQPEFGLLFSCLGRSPLLEIGTERDLQCVRHQFPDMPLIGCYGMGEIAPTHGTSRLLQHAAVLGLFKDT